MAATGTLITTLAWETVDTESPTRAEFGVNWSAIDTHRHRNRGDGGGVGGVQTSSAPTQAGDIQLTGDTFLWWGATATAVKTALDTDSVQTLTNKTWNGVAIGVPYGGTGVSTLTAHGVMLGAGTGNVVVTGTGTAGQVLTSNGAAADPTFQTPVTTTVIYKKLGKGTASTNQSITSTASPGTDVTSLSVTCTPDGTHDVKVTVSLPDIRISNNFTVFVALQKDGTIVDTCAIFPPNGQVFAMSFTYVDAAPSNASHTYKVSAWLSSAATFLTINGDGTAPTNLILVEQIG